MTFPEIYKNTVIFRAELESIRDKAKLLLEEARKEEDLVIKRDLVRHLVSIIQGIEYSLN